MKSPTCCDEVLRRGGGGPYCNDASQPGRNLPRPHEDDDVITPAPVRIRAYAGRGQLMSSPSPSPLGHGVAMTLAEYILASTDKCWQSPRSSAGGNATVWPSGLRRWLQAPGRKGVGSNPTAVTTMRVSAPIRSGTRRWNLRPEKAESMRWHNWDRDGQVGCTAKPT